MTPSKNKAKEYNMVCGGVYHLKASEKWGVAGAERAWGEVLTVKSATDVGSS